MNKKTKRTKKSIPYDDVIIDHLRDNPDEAAAYLNVALQDEDPRLFLVALKRVTLAFGGMKNAAEKSNLNRESLYKALSGKRNPRIGSISSLLRTMGFVLEVKAKQSRPIGKKVARSA